MAKGVMIDKERRTCTKHYQQVELDGICDKCRPNLDIYADQAYVNARNALIPEAMSKARIRMRFKKHDTELRPGADDREYKHCFFNEFFCASMTKLVKENELRL